MKLIKKQNKDKEHKAKTEEPEIQKTKKDKQKGKPKGKSQHCQDELDICRDDGSKIEIVKEIVESYKHPAKFYKGSGKSSVRSKGFVTPNKNIQIKPKQLLDTDCSNPKELVVDIVEEVGDISEEDKSKDESGHKFPEGKFESGHKPNKIVKSLLIEGKVLFEIEWERSENKIHPVNTLISEDRLRKQVEPKLFTKLVNDHINQE